jgi:hypothetical protein
MTPAEITERIVRALEAGRLSRREVEINLGFVLIEAVFPGDPRDRSLTRPTRLFTDGAPNLEVWGYFGVPAWSSRSTSTGDLRREDPRRARDVGRDETRRGSGLWSARARRAEGVCACR